MNILKPKRKLKLSTLLSILVSSSVIFTFIIVMVGSYQSEKRTLINAYLSLNYSKATKMSNSVDSLFSSMRGSLKDTAIFFEDYDEISDNDRQDQLELLRKTSGYFNSLSIIDETGLVQNIAPLSVGLKGDMITTGITKEVLDARKPALTIPYIAPTGRLLILMNHPIYDKKGNYKGMVAGAIYLHEKNVLNEILGNDIVESNGSYYYVVGPDGKLLFHPQMKRVGEDVTQNRIVKKLLRGESGMEKVTNTKGVHMYAAYSSIPGTSWGVVQQTPASYIEELLLSRVRMVILYILPPFIIVLTLSIFIARRLAKPFIQLANIVNQLGSGELVHLPKKQSHWNREADLLTKSVTLAIEAVKKNNDQLIHEAMTDALTNLPNRRKLKEVMESLVMEQQAFTLAIIDIDRFKQINDKFGHQMGDEVLKNLAETIQSMIRKSDICFRYGGEEFVLLLQNTTVQEAYIFAEKLRTTVQQKVTPVGQSITISLGIAEFDFHSHSLEELFKQADAALYESKKQGRNQTTIWSDKKS